MQRYGGTVDKFTGDGIMAVFGAPVSLEDHATPRMSWRRWTFSNRDDVERDGVDLQLRVGLNSGQVIAGEIGSGTVGYTAIGEHVGMAQRMESVAPPGGVMLSASTARLVDGVAALGEPEFVQIKGADGPASPPAACWPSRSAPRCRTRRVESGRSAVGDVGCRPGLLDRAIGGCGAVVGVVGTGLASARADSPANLRRWLATAACMSFTTFCESHTSQVPFHVVARLMRSATGVEGLDPSAARALIEARRFRTPIPRTSRCSRICSASRDPELEPPRIDPDARRRRLTALVNSATLASPTPAVYVIEDAHWIDESSESMLADFLTVVPQTPLLTLITYRPEYRGALARCPVRRPSRLRR